MNPIKPRPSLTPSNEEMQVKGLMAFFDRYGRDRSGLEEQLADLANLRDTATKAMEAANSAISKLAHLEALEPVLAAREAAVAAREEKMEAFDRRRREIAAEIRAIEKGQ